MRKDILTADAQAQLTPELVLENLKKGNSNYTNDSLTQTDNSSLRAASESGQAPQAIVLSCIDSRVVVEEVFDQALGDIFVARVAGNFVNTDIVASMEYACKVAGSKLIVVLGHEGCGAVKAACDDVELGNITALLSNIQPAVNSVKATVEGPYDSGNTVFVNASIVENVSHTITEIRSMSPILSELEAEGSIAIKGGVYQLANGEVKWL
ncbi:MAG: carbonic anhydrase [Flavobacteriales bacterium]|jgi:carbonic anhydrase|nr:MAG: carbonic anhydrase [Flavobacteriales bacterium]|tara:strand:+ start:926 stop:1555 length:630 start_codon:yes stop_codon:yes gene_type:complete